jgi:TonB family protein
MLTALLMLAAPPVNQSQLKPVFSLEDYPPQAMDAGDEGPVAFEVLVAPDGSVNKCTVIVSSHHQELDTATCKLVSARARFSAPQSKDGKPIYGIYRNVVTWSLGNVVSGSLNPELELQINQPPPGVKLPVVMTLDFLSKPDGSASDCHLADRSAGAPQALADLACHSILGQPPEIIRNSRGQPVEAGNNMVVRFSLGR